MAFKLKFLAVTWLNLSLSSFPCLAMEHSLSGKGLPLSLPKPSQKLEKKQTSKKTPRAMRSQHITVKLLNTPQTHQMMLENVVGSVKRRLVISSPLISETFVKDYFFEWLKGATKNIIITIYTNEKGALKLNDLIKQAEDPKFDKALIIKTTNNCPSKLVIGDKRILITGAYNWLGNVKDRKQLYVSSVIEGKGARKPIIEALNRLERNLCSERDDSLQAAISVKLCELNEDKGCMRAKRPLSLAKDTLMLTETFATEKEAFKQKE